MTSPVLLVIFNRPETTLRVFEQIARAKPARLYVAADGPRTPEEAARCDRAREIATSISWDCEVKTLFRDKNVGCQEGVKGAVDWFFDSEDAGIVLEDDCVPSLSFFKFCFELLARYRDDERIGSICGTSFALPGSVQESYYFSRYPYVWGWASWRRAWKNYDISLRRWPELRETKFLSEIGRSSWAFKTYWTNIFDECYRGEHDTAWDYQWVYSFWAKQFVACVPNRNLVSNVGFGEASTHHPKFDRNLHARPAEELCFPIQHPLSCKNAHEIDSETERRILGMRKVALQYAMSRYPFGRQTFSMARALKRSLTR